MALLLKRQTQLDAIVRRVDQILLRSQVPLGRLYRGVAQEQLDLLKLAARGPAQLRARPPQIVGRDARDTGHRRVLLEQLPNDLLAQAGVLNLVRPVHRPEYLTIGGAGSRCPGVDRHFHPCRHRHRAHTAMLPNEIDNAPAAVTLLDVLKRKGRHLGSTEAATKEHTNDGPIPQALLRRDVRRVQQPLGLPHG